MARNYPAAECYRCGREIPEGEPYWSLTRTREVMEVGAITVLGSADQVGSLCGDCAGSRPSIYDFLRDREPGTEPPWA